MVSTVCREKFTSILFDGNKRKLFKFIIFQNRKRVFIFDPTNASYKCSIHFCRRGETDLSDLRIENRAYTAYDGHIPKHTAVLVQKNLSLGLVNQILLRRRPLMQNCCHRLQRKRIKPGRRQRQRIQISFLPYIKPPF